MHATNLTLNNVQIIRSFIYIYQAPAICRFYGDRKINKAIIALLKDL